MKKIIFCFFVFLMLPAFSKTCALNTPNNQFSDENLHQLMQKEKIGLIYAISPYMHLSIKGINTIKKIAKKLKLPILILVDPEARKAKSEIQKLGFLIASKQLFMRGISIHYPSLIIYKNGQIISDAFPGLHDEQIYLNYIQGLLH